MMKKADVWSIVNSLKQLYPDSICSLQYEKDYELLFAVRLAAQCTDERVNQVTPALYARFPTLEALAGARSALEGGLTPDAVLTDVETAMHAIGEVTGRTLREDLVDRIFSRFCVGK